MPNPKSRRENLGQIPTTEFNPSKEVHLNSENPFLQSYLGLKKGNGYSISPEFDTLRLDPNNPAATCELHQVLDDQRKPYGDLVAIKMMSHMFFEWTTTAPVWDGKKWIEADHPYRRVYIESGPYGAPASESFKLKDLQALRALNHYTMTLVNARGEIVDMDAGLIRELAKVFDKHPTLVYQVFFDGPSNTSNRIGTPVGLFTMSMIKLGAFIQREKMEVIDTPDASAAALQLQIKYMEKMRALPRP